MSDLGERFEDAKRDLRFQWPDDREARVAQRISHSAHVRARAFRVARAVALGVVIFGAGYQIWSFIAVPRPSGEVRFADGSTATLLGADSRLSTAVDRPAEVEVDVSTGGARFEVVHDPSRSFHVTAGGVRVEVVGTRFTVQRKPGGVWVAVERGEVRAFYAGNEDVLGPGESKLYSDQTAARPLPANPPSNEVEVAEAAPPAAPTVAVAPAAPTPDWRERARAGDFARAYGLLQREGPSKVRDDAQDLFLASDVARLSGHPEQALAPLQSLISRHGKDSRAPLAAFTLGRVLLEDLGRPREAAQTFAQMRAQHPEHALAEDALAREVEAWARAGEIDRAHAAAQAYLSLYPQGQRVAAVRRYGGLE